MFPSARSPLHRETVTRHRHSRRLSRRLLAGGALSAVVMLAGACKRDTPPPAAKAAPAPAAAAPSGDVPEPVRKLLGRWMRADGGYVLELKGGDRSGVIQAAYFNPKPINVSRAIWMQGGSGFQIVVELNDVGYPGATYVLSHDAQSDRLIGQYNQPAMQQSFDVEFVRQRSP